MGGSEVKPFIVSAATMCVGIFVGVNLTLLLTAAEPSTLTLKVFPRFIVSQPFRTHYAFLFTSKLVDPERTMPCADYDWDWGDGSRSAQVSDCDPEGTQPAVRIESRGHTYRAPGEYIVSLRVRSGTRVKVVEAKAVVLGEDEIGGGQ